MTYRHTNECVSLVRTSLNPSKRYLLIVQGFTAAELDVMEALALTSAKGPSIELPEVELHPCLRRPLWGKPLPKHLAIFPMRNGMTGNWEVGFPNNDLSTLLIYSGI